MHRGLSAWPASSCAPTTARSTTCARCWRRSATCATTCCGTRPGSATTPSTRCSTTTARCGCRTWQPEMAGLFSTQSVHKQGAGFSQASQIHKRDEHIRGQKRFVDHKRFNESFLQHASTSPFYPLFASLDVNAKIHEGKARRDAVGPLHRARHRDAQEAARVRPPFARQRPQRAGAVVLRPLRARPRHRARHALAPMPSTCRGKACPPS